MKNKKNTITLVSIVCFLIDMFTKYICKNINITIIKNFFYLKYIKNTGAAFSIFKNQTIILIIVSILGLNIILKIINDYKDNKFTNIAFGLLIGGILGNLFDRVLYHYVRDFIGFIIFNYYFPIFNMADTFIVIGIIILIIYSVWEEKDENSSK